MAKPDLPPNLNAAWDAAFDLANNGVAIPIGDIVVCDDCNEDYTNSTESGGFIFGSRGICPDCAGQWMVAIERHKEQRYIKKRCREGQSFADMVREFRGPNATIKVTGGRRR